MIRVGNVNIEFLRGVDNPKISAIEIVPNTSPTAVRVHVTEGGGSFGRKLFSDAAHEAERIEEGAPREGVAIFRPVEKAVLVGESIGATIALGFHAGVPHRSQDLVADG